MTEDIQKPPTRSKPPKEAYKFFDSAFLKPIRDRGSIRIGTSAAFRVQDGIEDGRADTREMENRWAPSQSITINQHHPFAQNLLARGGMDWPGGIGDLTIEIENGAQFRMHTNAYMLCLSAELDDELCRGMLEKFGYDMVYHIPDIEQFILALAKSDVRLAIGECDYVLYDAPDEADQVWRPSHFRKRESFSWQHEIRLIWGGQAPLEPFTVDVPTICPCISIMRNPASI